MTTDVNVMRKKNYSKRRSCRKMSVEAAMKRSKQKARSVSVGLNKRWR